MLLRITQISSISFFLLILTTSHASAVIFGGLEARYESYSDDKCDSYFEKWINLNQKSTSDLSWGVLGMHRGGVCNDTQLQHLFISKKLADAPLPFQITAGRFEHMDEGGFYTLDGFDLKSWAGDIEVETYAGTPKRLEFYPTLSNALLKKDSPSGDHIAGLSIRSPITGLLNNSDDQAFLKLGIRHYWGGDVTESRL